MKPICPICGNHYLHDDSGRLLYCPAIDKCSMGIILDASLTPEMKVKGKQLKKHEDFEENDVFVEFRCNRPEKHEKFGSEHWCDLGDGIRITWTVSEDGVWVA